jgi:integrase
MQVYQSALGAQPQCKAEIGAGRTKPGTMNAAIVSFYKSASYQALRPETKSTYKSVLEGFRAKHGDKGIATLQRRHILNLLAEKADHPAAQRHLLKMLKLLLNHALEQEWRPDNPALAIKLRYKSDGFHTWSEAEIAQFEMKHPIGTKSRLALALLLYTAQRRKDAIRMGRQHVRKGYIHVKQSKTGTELSIPIHPELAKIIEAMNGENLTFLVNERGKPYPSSTFGSWFRQQCRLAGLPAECAAHGLRKAACRLLAEAGCSAHQIMAISGHRSVKEIDRYTREAAQVRLAKDAIQATITAFPRTEQRTSGVKPSD